MQDLVGIGRRIVKPANCAMAFGIPTSKVGFARYRTTGQSDFTRRFKGGWPEYHQMVVGVFDTVVPILRLWGVSIVQDLTQPALRALFRDGHHVVILFSHWKGDSVEMFDGFLDSTAFLEQVPEEFSGVVDLCIWHPNALSLVLRRHRPKCLVKEIPGTATPDFWLYFYWALFRVLKDEDLTYLVALEKVIKTLVKKK